MKAARVLRGTCSCALGGTFEPESGTQSDLWQPHSSGQAEQSVLGAGRWPAWPAQEHKESLCGQGWGAVEGLQGLRQEVVGGLWPHGQLRRPAALSEESAQGLLWGLALRLWGL